MVVEASALPRFESGALFRDEREWAWELPLTRRRSSGNVEAT